MIALDPPSPVAPTIDLDAPGVRRGWLRLPWSRNESAWGNMMIPVAVAVGGEGPTALVTGGAHGDEYEGPLAILDCAQGLEGLVAAAGLRGRVILIPFLNFPAVKAGARVSPVDGVNMNRCFPGAPDGSPTLRVADFVLRALAPRADIVLDFHSGGRTLDFLPFAASHVLPDADLDARAAAAAAAFAAPWTVRMLEIDAGGMFDTAVEALGIPFVTTELGGGGGATAARTAIAKRGLRNVLIHAGVLAGAPERAPSRRLAMPSLDCYAFAETGGMVEPLVDLGEPVRRGAPLARIWPLDRIGPAPEVVSAGLDGVLAARHFPGLAQPGDTLAVVAVPADPVEP